MTDSKVIHIAKKEGELYLLMQSEVQREEFCWISALSKQVIISAKNQEEAIRLGYRKGLIPLFCGIKFLLPERDEHGQNALFSEMVESLRSSNGQYFDKKAGHLVIVKEIPLEGRRWLAQVERVM